MSVLTNIANEIGRIQNAKSGIANAIKAKGVTVPSTAKLNEYPGFINLISGSGGSGSSILQGKVVGAFNNSDLYGVFSNAQTLVYADISAAEGVTSMGYTFNGCSNLSNAPVIPSSVTNMYFTFCGCSSIVNAPVIPGGVGDMAYTFSNCTSLINAPAIPGNVTNMSFTFNYCSSMVNAPVIPASVTNLYYAFNNCSSLVNAPVVSNGVTNLTYAFPRCANLVHVPALPVSVTEMSHTFDGCVNLVNAPIIPSAAANISYAFNNCTSLVNAPIIPSGVTNMSHTFDGCVNLVNAPAIPASVTDISYMFDYCASLVNAPVIPNSVSNMYAPFYGCSGITSTPAIPESVMSMPYAFTSCAALTGDIEIMSRNVVNCYSCFNGTTAAKTVYTRGTTFDTFNASYGAGENGVTLIHLYDWDKYSGSGVYTPYSERYDTSAIGTYNQSTSSKYYNNRNSSNMSSGRSANSTVYWSDSITLNVVAGTFVLENTISVSYANSTNLTALYGKYFASSANPSTIYYANANATYGRGNNTSTHTYYTYLIGERYYNNVSYTPASYSGTYIGSVNSADPAAYPAAGLQGGYYYVSLDAN